MGAKTVQRYIALNNLVPDLMTLADDKKIPFMTAFEMSYCFYMRDLLCLLYAVHKKFTFFL